MNGLKDKKVGIATKKRIRMRDEVEDTDGKDWT